jgi:nitrogenase molybdenum-iron protein beta chain
MSELLQEPRHFCALGAQQTVTAIERAIPIVHAGPGCSAKLTAAMSNNGGHQGSGYAGGDAIPCSNLIERDVIFGGEKKLRQLIEGTLKVMDGDFFVVLTGCISDIVGDDVGSVVREFQKKGVPIVYAETGGFKGDAYKGHELVLKAIINQYLKPSDKTIKGLVNVFASAPNNNPFWEGDLNEIKSLLKSIGLKANILFGYNSGGIDAINAIPNAEFNLVLSPWLGLKAAKLLKEKFGIPYLHYPVLPVGGTETSKFLKTIGEFAKLPSEEVAKVVEEKEKEYFHYLVRSAEFLVQSRYGLPKKFFIIDDSAYALGIGKFLVNDLGLLPSHQFITEDVPEEYREKIIKYFKDFPLGISADISFIQDGGIINEEIIKYDVNTTPLVLGSSWDVDIAEELKGIHLSIGLPIADRLILNHTYIGYRGGLSLVEDIYSKLLSLLHN